MAMQLDQDDDDDDDDGNNDVDVDVKFRCCWQYDIFFPFTIARFSSFFPPFFVNIYIYSCNQAAASGRKIKKENIKRK